MRASRRGTGIGADEKFGRHGVMRTGAPGADPFTRQGPRDIDASRRRFGDAIAAIAERIDLQLENFRFNNNA